MVSKVPQEFRKFLRNCSHLKRILNDTHRSLEEITAANICPGDDVQGQVLSSASLRKLTSILSCQVALVILGQSWHAKIALANAIFGMVLPNINNSCKWIRLVYGHCNNIPLQVSQEYEMECQQFNNHWFTVPDNDFVLSRNERLPTELSMVLEIKICHSLLRDNVEVLLSPECESVNSQDFQEIVQKALDKILPIFLYAVDEERLSEHNVKELQTFKNMFPDLPFFFVYTAGSSPLPYTELTESEQHQILLQESRPMYHPVAEMLLPTEYESDMLDQNLRAVMDQLSSLGFLNLDKSVHMKPDITHQTYHGHFTFGSDFLDGLHKLDELLIFIRGCLQLYLVKAANLLTDIHSQCLRHFILTAFDMARELQITPRRIQYAREKEADLYKNLMSIANEKQEELTTLIQVTLQDMKDNLLEKAGQYCYKSISISDTEEVKSVQIVNIATLEIQHFVLNWLNNSVATQLVQSINCLQDSLVGTLQRCVESLEKNCHDQNQNLQASDAIKQILNAAYNVEVNTSTSSSLLHSFLERLRVILHGLQLPWTAAPRLDAAWRRKVATDILNSLIPARLAKSVSAQFRERVRASHQSFQVAMKTLESHYSGHLERTEEQRVAIRKIYAPRLARLALESTSMCDMVQYGMPVLGKEIGRGQYGVVFACESWSGAGPCAVKSVVPPDEKHWNDLAMEFYYTRTIAEHKHIVKLRGSVMDHMYGGGSQPAVLLIMDRLCRDLYCGLRTGLKWLIRLQIAIDVVEGMRYLHSQGLVHRDIKLKNVLLDEENRAKLTDLGFCIPEAMMSGSIVGTPVHMAPELLSGHYDSSVDVYAFGILFWYICAGHVHLPCLFEQFHNKEQLWTSVRKGIRPERLPHFDEQCWLLMEQCWSGEPKQRPLLGDVLPLLQSIRVKYSQKFNIR